ncbi:MAG: hypothetical protein V4537_16570 [Pseudomonadota bacterium]
METPEGRRIGLARTEFAKFSDRLYRISLHFKDFDSGEFFASWTKVFDRDPVAGRLIPPQVLAWSDSLFPAYSGITFTVQLNVDRIVLADKPPFSTEYHSYEECGLHPDALFTSIKMNDFLIAAPNAARTVKVGSERDFNDLKSATAALYLPPTDLPDGKPTYSVFPLSDTSTYATPVRHELSELGIRPLADLITTPYQVIQGLGRGRSAFTNALPGLRMIEATQSVRISGVTLIQSVNEYAIHSDNNGVLSRPATVGPPGQHWFIRQVFDQIEIVGTGEQAVPLVGMGLSSGMQVIVRDSVLRRDDLLSFHTGWLLHDTPNTTLPGRLHWQRVTARVGQRSDLSLHGLFSNGIRHDIVIEDCDLDGIFGDVTIADDSPTMPARARDRWPYTLDIVRGRVGSVTVLDPKMRVLQMPTGTRIIGAAPALGALFGSGYDPASGCGDQLMLDGSIRALGRRLGDRRADPWTFTFTHPTIETESLTVSGDYRAMSEHALLAAMNNALARFSVRTARIDTSITS